MDHEGTKGTKEKEKRLLAFDVVVSAWWSITTNGCELLEFKPKGTSILQCL
ncbi:MAG: hypothetical protein GY765_03155 [bacterium]|nr:hypothetical protein [bacterium]